MTVAEKFTSGTGLYRPIETELSATATATLPYRTHMTKLTIFSSRVT